MDILEIHSEHRMEFNKEQLFLQYYCECILMYCCCNYKYLNLGAILVLGFETQLLLMNCPVNVDVISLNGAALQVSENGIHLGCPIGRNCNNYAINTGISDIVYRTNVVMTKFGFCTYCMIAPCGA